MSSAAKGMAALVAALALIAGVAVWLLNDTSTSSLLSSSGRKNAASEQAPLASPATAQSRSEAQRAAEANPAPAPVEAAEGALPAGTPTADFLAGVVVDQSGQPVANADLSFAPASLLGPRTRGGRNLRVRPQLAKETPEIPAVVGRTGPDGSFKLVKVPRGDGYDLTVDHPDFVFLRKSGVVLPSKGLDLGRITLEAGGAVSGQVFGPGGAKLADAEVWLEDAPDSGGNNNFFAMRMFGFSQTRGERKATTDEHGRFHLAGMPPGKCVVFAKSSDCPEGESPAIELKVHEEVGNVVVNLEAGDRITGTVKGPDGKPVAGAEIHVNPPGQRGRGGMTIKFGGHRNPFEPDATTDAQGRFEVKALKRGSFNVVVDAKGFSVKELTDVDSTAAPLEIALSAGTHLAGTVHIKDSPELPKNVKVQLTPAWDGMPPLPSFDFPDADNIATQDGAFVIQDVEPGKYRIVARGDDTTRGTSETVEVADGQSLENVEVTVERGAVVAGRVVDAATGAAVAGVEVSASTIPQDDGSSGRFGAGQKVSIGAVLGGGRSARRFTGAGSRQTVGRAKTDAEGKYEVKGLPAGQFTIDAHHADYAALRSAPLDLKAAEAKGSVDLNLMRGGTIEGTVTGIDGKPRTGDRVDVTSNAVDGITLNAVSDANGCYRVEHVPAGDGVATRAEPEKNAPGRPVFRMAFAGDSQEEAGKPFTLKEGDVARIDFAQQEKPWVEGVVRSVSGPIAGATVMALPNNDRPRMVFGDQKSATTGADGSYRIADLDPGSYRISVRHPQGIVPVQQPVELKSGEPARQDFFLEGGVIEGSVAAQKNHAALEGAIVTLERVKDDAGQDSVTTDVVQTFAISLAGGGRGRRGGGMQAYSFGGDPGRSQVMTDSTGHFQIPWIPAGKWKVSASHTGFLATRSDPVELAANGKVEGVRLELPPAAQLIVHMKSKGTGLPMSGVPVEANMEDGGHEFRMTDDDGAATFDSLKPGTWTVSGRKGFNNGDPVKKTVEAPADRTTEVTIDA